MANIGEHQAPCDAKNRAASIVLLQTSQKIDERMKAVVFNWSSTCRQLRKENSKSFAFSITHNIAQDKNKLQLFIIILKAEK